MAQLEDEFRYRELPSLVNVKLERRLPRPPFWLIAALVIATVVSWLPLVVIARGRVNKSPEPRIHIIQDMDNQVKYKEQKASPVFADGRADRPRIVGTVARSLPLVDEKYDHGYVVSTVDGKSAPDYVTQFPSEVTVDKAFLLRGQAKFNIYCAPCHGIDGQGAGAIHVRADEVSRGPLSYNTAWVQPSNLTDETRRLRPVGHIYNTVTNGIRNMGGYGGQIQRNDRWAIVAYVRALQLSQSAPLDLVPKDKLQAMIPSGTSVPGDTTVKSETPVASGK